MHDDGDLIPHLHPTIRTDIPYLMRAQEDLRRRRQAGRVSRQNRGIPRTHSGVRAWARRR